MNLSLIIMINGLFLASAFTMFVTPDIKLRWTNSTAPRAVTNPLHAADSAYRAYSVCAGLAVGFLFLAAIVSWALIYDFGHCLRDVDFLVFMKVMPMLLVAIVVVV